MDTNRLRYFCVVSETGSIRKASEVLHVSSAALSKAIKLLEYEVGFQLLIPEGRGILISERGRRLALAARPVLNQLGMLSESTLLAPSQHEVLRLGSFEVFTTYFLGFLMKKWVGKAQLELREFLPGELEHSVLSQDVDFGITYVPIPMAGLDHVKITDIEMSIVARRGVFSSLPIDQLPFVVPILPLRGTPNKAQGLDGWPDHKIKRNIYYRVTLMESALELCRQGVAAAYLPKFVVELHKKQVKPELQLEVFAKPKGLGSQSQGVYLIKRKTDVETAMMRKLGKALREVTS